MSVGAVTWAKTWTGELNRSERFLLILIADYFNDSKHYAWPSIFTLAQIMGLTERSVFRALKRLREEGLVETEARYRESGLRLTSAFYLPLYDPASEKSQSPWLASASARTSRQG